MKFSKKSLERLKGVDERLVVFAAIFLIKYPEYDIAVVEGLRSLEKQKEYVAKGFSWTLESKHLTGHALDIYPVGWKNFTHSDWNKWSERIETLASELGLPIKCGWSLWKKDAFHIELRD